MVQRGDVALPRVLHRDVRVLKCGAWRIIELGRIRCEFAKSLSKSATKITIVYRMSKYRVTNQVGNILGLVDFNLVVPTIFPSFSAFSAKLS